MAVTNIAGLNAAVAAVCPIDGVAADGTIFFQPSATPAQRAAAQAAVAAFVDQPPLVSDLETLVQELATLGILPAASLARVRRAATPRPAPPQIAPLPQLKSILQA